MTWTSRVRSSATFVRLWAPETLHKTGRAAFCKKGLFKTFVNTAIVAPVAGMVGNRTLRVGQYVSPGTQLMAVVPTANAYVVANFKETQLTDVRPGQAVDIEVDMFPDRTYHGRVDNLASASGPTFALLPPENATGNLTDVVQRIPVRITLDAKGGAGDLRPGMSVTPSIDTNGTPGVITTAQGD